MGHIAAGQPQLDLLALLDPDAGQTPTPVAARDRVLVGRAAAQERLVAKGRRGGAEDDHKDDNGGEDLKSSHSWLLNDRIKGQGPKRARGEKGEKGKGEKERKRGPYPLFAFSTRPTLPLAPPV